MRTLLALAATLSLALGTSVRADEGGYKDPNTGKVWSPSITHLESSQNNWTYSNSFAASYSVTDLNSQGQLTVYDDWRLPTLTELQTAVENGTIQMLHNTWPTYINMSYWTSTKKGNKYYAVRLMQDANGTIVGTQLIWTTASTRGYNAYMIRP